MKKLIVTIPEKSKTYPIIIGQDILDNIDILFELHKYSKIAVITGENVAKFWLKDLESALPVKASLVIIPSGEKEKNIDTVINIWKQMQRFNLDRNTLVINLGGGVATDMGGFAASTFLRGIDFLQVPTSLLAQVDASVGGKVGINFGNIKNYIGTFQQPIGVLIDVNTLATLPTREFAEGFGEVIKHGLIQDKIFFDFVTAKKPKEFNTSELIQIIARCNDLKTKVVEADEKEAGYRKIVNFGHTIGHAIESLSLQTGKPMLHGEAVHVGMLAETKISELMDILSKEEADIIYDRLAKTGLPVSVSGLKADEIIERSKFDKKMAKGQVQWTLLSGIGHGIYNQKVDEKTVRQALQAVIK